MKAKDKQKNLKGTREKGLITYKGASIWITSWFHIWKNGDPEGSRMIWSPERKNCKKKKKKTAKDNFTFRKLSFKNEGKNKDILNR